MPLWLGQKLHISKIISKETGYEGDVLFTEHHEAHQASAFYPSPFDEAAILTIDGVGEWATASCGFGQGKDITLLKELHYPDSLGLLYSAFTYIPALRLIRVNTSFNVRGEPIICSPEDAYRCFMRTEMDVLVIEDYILFKEQQPPWQEKEDWQNEFELD